MAAQRTTPVVGVFGSSARATLEPARTIGEAVAASGCVLLTGGGRKPAQRSVKERAMVGARDAEATGARASRVGVLGKESSNVAITIAGPEAILEPNLGDGRNYLNAAMCDVAIAFPGGNGTDSEVAFALALGRPVLLIGEDWTRSFPAGEGRAREALVESATKRVDGVDGSALAGLVTSAYDTLMGADDLLVERFRLDHPDAELAARARELAEQIGLRGDIPTLSDRPDLDPLAERYRDWLANLH